MRIAFSSLLSLAVASLPSPQATTFDIATFTPPAGWQRIDQNGMVLLQATRTANARDQGP
jgi:hypothetical protein